SRAGGGGARAAARCSSAGGKSVPQCASSHTRADIVLILTRFDAVPVEYRRRGRVADRHLISWRPERIESRRWTVFPAGLTRSSFVVKAAVALSPILIS